MEHPVDLSLTIHKAYQEVLKKVSKIVFKRDMEPQWKALRKRSKGNLELQNII